MDAFFSIPTLTQDSARAALVDALKLTGTATDPVLEGLVRAAAAALECPIAAVTLIDARDAIFRSRVGIARERLPLTAVPCTLAIQGPGLCEVPDVLEDPDFAGRPLVSGGRAVRFYAGVTLEVGDVRVGTLCVMDWIPRTLTDQRRRLLTDLALSAQNSLEILLERHGLDQESSHYRAVFEHLSDGVLLFDDDAICRSANRAAATIFGYRRDELIGMELHRLIPQSSDRGQLYKAMGDEAGTPFLSEYEHVRPDGSRVFVESNARRVDEGRYVSVIRRIDERIEAEQTLRKLSLAVDQSTDSVMVTDLHGTIEYVNDACLSTSGYEREDFIGKTSRVLHSGKTPESTYKAMWEALGAGQSWRGPLINRRKDGSEYVEVAVISPLRTGSGRVTHYVAVKQNVTEFRRMGEELEQYRHHMDELVSERTAELEQARRNAEAASRAKSAFLATVSHEIRTPMNGVVGLIDVLRQSALSTHQSQLIDTIRESSFALLGIIDDILDFSKIESGHLTLQETAFDLRAMVEGVCDSLLPLAVRRGVVMHGFVDPALPATVISDPLRIRQILNNLIGNAIKFSASAEHGGRVRVSVERDAAGLLRLAVSDNGIGMTPETQARVFQPFEQAEGSTTRRYGGTGLGLAICRRLVELFGGAIAIDSQPGLGTRMTVTLPLMAERDGGNPAPVRDLRGLECAVLHEDLALAGDLVAYLSGAGATVRAPSDPDDIARALDEHREGVVIALVERADDSDALDRLQANHADGGVRLVALERGKRRRPIVRRAGLVTLDTDCLHRDALLESVLLAAGLLEPQEANAPEPVVDAGESAAREASVAPAGTRAPSAHRILVAEDNELNQHVIQHQLALLGIDADIASDGVEALERLRGARYALLLTDLHMPRMDGYELAGTVRGEGGALGRIAIVALTANALKDEREHCLAIGMDDYLTKPVQLDQLAAALARWMPSAEVEFPGATEVEGSGAAEVQGSGATGSGATAAAGTVERARPAGEPDASAKPSEPDEIDGLAVLDAGALARLVGDDAAVLAEFRSDFIAAARTAAGQIEAAASASDWKAVGGLGHKLKSSSRSVGAMVLGAHCEALEKAGKTGDAEAVAAALPQFTRALEVALARTAALIPCATGVDDEPSAGIPTGSTAGSAATAPAGAAPAGGAPVGAVPAASAPAASAPAASGPLSLVAIDDEPFQLQTIHRQLMEIGMREPTLCGSGADALEWLQGRDASRMLLLLDLNMPGMDGVELMRHLASLDFPGAIVLVSGADRRLLESAARLGTAYRLNMLGILPKPVPTDSLRDLMTRWTERCARSPIPATT